MSPLERFAADVIVFLAGSIGWIKFWFEIREKRREKVAKEKAEASAAKANAELLAIRRRGEAPYLSLSAERFGHLYYSTGKPGEMGMWSCGDVNVLSDVRDEVGEEMEAGDPVILVVENTGQATRRTSIKLDAKPIKFVQEPKFQGANDRHFLEYAFVPELRGKEQVIQIQFEAVSGVQDTHLYLTEHGRRVLHRIDPA